MTKEITTTQPKEVASVESFISQAITEKVDINTLERLLAMRTTVKAEQAKEAFVGAMAQFQSECPIIEKKKVVNDKYGKKRYSYAPLESIVGQVKEALARNGLSYDFDEIKDDKFVSAVCTITHIMGHSKQSTFKVEIGNEDYMTDTQKYGARMTFAKRYAFCNAFGILTGDEDTDAHEEKEVKIPAKPVDIKVEIMTLLKTLNPKITKDMVHKEITRLTGMELSEHPIKEDLQETKDRLEVLISEIPKK